MKVKCRQHQGNDGGCQNLNRESAESFGKVFFLNPPLNPGEQVETQQKTESNAKRGENHRTDAFFGRRVQGKPKYGAVQCNGGEPDPE